jgi:hypothetical protein
MYPDQDEHDNANWRFVYKSRDQDEAKDAHDVETILRCLQAMATKESMLDHKDSWNLVEHVFEWLTDYTTDRRLLRDMSSDLERLHQAKARRAKVTKDRIARVGTKGLLR